MFFRDNYTNNIIGEDGLRDFKNIVVNNLYNEATNMLYEVKHNMVTIEVLAGEIVEYFRNHNLDQEGLVIYLQAMDVLKKDDN